MKLRVVCENILEPSLVIVMTMASFRLKPTAGIATFGPRPRFGLDKFPLVSNFPHITKVREVIDRIGQNPTHFIFTVYVRSGKSLTLKLSGEAILYQCHQQKCVVYLSSGSSHLLLTAHENPKLFRDLCVNKAI